MSDPRSGDNDPSMDDILASIRKIISDDEARAQVAQGGVAGAQPSPAGSSSSDPRPATTSRAGATANREDVLLLTDLIEEPKLNPAGPRPAAPTPLPIVDPVRAGEMPQPHIGESTSMAAQASSSSGEPSLVGSTVAGAASSAFDRLSQALEQQHAPAAPAPVNPGPALGTGGKTIEDLVREMLRPMLKDWLDRNLPPLVERLVEREITRLTRR